MRSQVFVHQSRINIKQQNGSIVEWHQDFGTYHRVDGIPEARGIMIGVFAILGTILTEATSE